MDITVIGKGLFGTAIGSLLESNNQKFRYVDIDLPMDRHADLVVITTPTQFIRQALTHNQQWFKPDTIFINCAKGIEQETHLLPHQITAQLLKPAQYFCLMGPSFAQDLTQRQPTLLSLGYTQAEPDHDITSLFTTPYCHIQASPDLIAIEYMAALKNVYAILCGFAEGLGYGMNTRAKLITLAVQESAQYINGCNWSFHGAAQPGIMGDLLMTCSSTDSRNFTFGTLLANHSAADAVTKINATVEGYYTSTSIQALSQQHPVPLPLATLTHTIIEQGQAARPLFNQTLADL